MITDRDKEILRYFEKYHFGTIRLIEKLFFPSQSFSYNIVVTRMKELQRAGYIKVFTDVVTKRNIYVLNNPVILKQKPTLHRMLCLEIYAQLKVWGVNVLKYDIEKEWCGGKYRSDAITVFELMDPYTKKLRRYHFFIEVLLSNNSPNLEKYDNLYSTGEIQEYLGYDFYPKYILFVTDRNYNYCGRCTAIRINTSLNKLVSILM